MKASFYILSFLQMLVRSIYLPARSLVKQYFHPRFPIVTSYRKIQSQVMGLPLNEVVTKLETFAPSWLAEPWDNVGLLLEPCEPTNIKSVLLTNDLTEDVMDEAVSLGVQLIISYHPPLFKPMKTITNKHWKVKTVYLYIL